MNRLAPTSLACALIALATAIVAIIACWTWLLVPCAIATALALICAFAGWTHAAKHPPRWHGRLWAGGALGLVFFAFMGIMQYTAVAHSDEKRLRDAAGNQLKEIAYAMHAYFHAHGRIPPAAILDKDGRPLLSWRVAVLAHLDKELYARFRLDEPWDSPHNQELLAEMPSAFAALHRPDVRSPNTVWRVLVGPGTPFDPAGSFQLPPTDLPLGPSALLLIVEAAEGVPWTKPEDLPYAPGQPLPPLGSVRRYASPPMLFVPNPSRWMVAIDVLGMIRDGNLDTTDEATMRQAVAH